MVEISTGTPSVALGCTFLSRFLAFVLELETRRGVLERVSAVGFCQEMAVVAAISQVKDCYKILKHIILPMYTN